MSKPLYTIHTMVHNHIRTREAGAPNRHNHSYRQVSRLCKIGATWPREAVSTSRCRRLRVLASLGSETAGAP